MKKLIKQITWKTIVGTVFVMGSFLGGYNLHLYQNRSWFDKVLSFFS